MTPQTQIQAINTREIKENIFFQFFYIAMTISDKINLYLLWGANIKDQRIKHFRY